MHKFLRPVLSLTVTAFFITLSAPAFADGIQSPEPASGGKFVRGKGTKAAETYETEGRAGGVSYEYGRGLQAGPVLIKPYVNLNEYWDNNIFLDENGREDDYVTHLAAGLSGELPLAGGQHALASSYRYEYEWFNDHSVQDHGDHNFQIAGDFNFVPFSLTLEDTLKRTVDRSDTEFTDRVERVENAFHGVMEIPFAQFFLEEEYINYMVDFREDVQSEFDRMDNSFYQRVGFDIAPSTQLLGEYGYIDIEYPEAAVERDGDAHQLSLGLRGNLTERITYQAWAGFQGRVYQDSQRPDFHGAVARGALQYDITDKSYVILRGDRRPEESTFDNQSFYTRNRLEVEWRQQVAERLFFSTREVASYNEYSRTTLRGGDDETRRDWVWQTGLGLEYFMPNDLISFLVEYKFRSRDSNTANLDYDAQTVSVGVKSLF